MSILFWTLVYEDKEKLKEQIYNHYPNLTKDCLCSIIDAIDVLCYATEKQEIKDFSLNIYNDNLYNQKIIMSISFDDSIVTTIIKN